MGSHRQIQGSNLTTLISFLIWTEKGVNFSPFSRMKWFRNPLFKKLMGSQEPMEPISTDPLGCRRHLARLAWATKTIWSKACVSSLDLKIRLLLSFQTGQHSAFKKCLQTNGESGKRCCNDIFGCFVFQMLCKLLCFITLTAPRFHSKHKYPSYVYQIVSNCLRLKKWWMI